MNKLNRQSAKRLKSDLTLVTSLGGQTRHHRYLSHLRAFVLLCLISISLQVVVYCLSIFTSKQLSLEPTAIAMLALGVPVVMSALVLAAFRRHDAPIVSAIVVFTTLFCAMVTVISASRMPVSYSALLACGAIGLFFASAANYRFHSLSGEKVRIVPFPGAGEVCQRIPGARILAEDAFDGNHGKVNFDVLLIDENSYRSADWAEFISRMHAYGVDIVTCEDFLERLTGGVNVPKFELFHIVYSPSQLLYARVKRYFDLAFVIVFCPILLLIALFAAIYIFARDPGPVLFVQIRRGFNNKPFRMYKFRTMFRGTAGGATVTADPRIIPGCEILRKLRIDEIPQCFNILRGEMSLIGPRPSAEYLAKAIIKMEPKYAYRCVVAPGLTGWAQVTSGHVDDINDELTKLSQDLFYIKRVSIDMDLVILVKTIRTVLFGSGAK